MYSVVAAGAASFDRPLNKKRIASSKRPAAAMVASCIDVPASSSISNDFVGIAGNGGAEPRRHSKAVGQRLGGVPNGGRQLLNFSEVPFEDVAPLVGDRRL